MDDSPSGSSSSTHAHLYKYKESPSSQEERRKKHLEELKEKRHQEMDKNRDLGDEFLKKFEDEDMEQECVEEKPRRKYIDFKLMMTEWFVDIPDDLQENWLAKFVPEGFRVLLITRNRFTCFYSHKGAFLFRLKTHFPGGGGNNVSGITVLDCICNRTTGSIFILDCLYWNSMYTVNSEADFRFFWLKTKFRDMPELSKSVNLTYKFFLIDCIPAERSLIQDKMFETCELDDNEVLYDGITFYHKESEYTFGFTPLAAWLFSYMLPEKLNIDIPEVYSKRAPEGYVNLQHYIINKKKFESNKKKREQKKKKERAKKRESTDEMEKDILDEMEKEITDEMDKESTDEMSKKSTNEMETV